MADKQKFEKMLELLINEDREGAEELFHEIVVEQSRSIYETILEDDLNDEEANEADDEDDDATNEADDEEADESDDDDVNESADDDDEAKNEADDEDVDESNDDEVSEDFDLDEFEVEADPTDDMMGDVEFGGDDDGEEDDLMAMGGDDEEGEGDVDDRLTDLEDAFDDLKAEFDKMMGGDSDMDMDGDDEDGDDMDMDMDGDEESDDEDPDMDKEELDFEDFTFEDDEDDVAESKKTEAETMREYVDKIAGKGGLDVSNSNKSEESGTNTQSTVASKNDMGGTAENILRTDTEDSGEAGAGSKIKGSALNDQNEKEDSAGNVNVPGGKASKSMKNQPKGHGTEKKGKADAAPNKHSLIGSKKR